MSANTFGEIFRVTTCGESHGAALGCIIDGCPPVIDLNEQMLQTDLDRRRPGSTRFGTPRNEPDKVKIMGENKVGSHKWIEIELDNGNIIIADATDSINGELDLAKCKSSFSSNGFFYCNKFFL